ncbi:Putative colanic acid biosynthesis acetyltransferase WcaF, partial [Durusdinium trenchii]
MDAESSAGDHAILYCLGPVTIGKRVMISQNAHICAGSHDYSLRAMPLLRPPIIIEDDVWIAADAFVGPAVRVGEGAILGARGCAMTDLEPWTIYAGNPVQKVKERASLGHEVVIAAYRGDGESTDRAQGLLDETPNGELVKVIWLPQPSKVERVTGKGGASRLDAEFAHGVDVIHCHGMWDPLFAATARVAKRRSIPFVVMPHGMLDPYTYSIRKRKKQLAIATTHRTYVQHAMFYHMLNADEAELARPVIGDHPVRVIPNGIFLDEIDTAPPAGAFRAERPELGNEPYVLFLGRLTHKKGLDILAPAFEIVARAAPN